MSDDREAALQALQERIGHRFADPALLERALTHTSWANEALETVRRHNEPFEFLGDAVIGFVVTELLHARDPEGAEGAKTKARARLVSATSLARKAEALGLPAVLRLGRGEEKTGGRTKRALWADGYEALVAALYLDGGLDAARRFVSAEFADSLEAATRVSEDWKSELQERLQGRGAPLPEYVLVAEESPSHSPRFRVQCRVEGESLAEGVGPSKKVAQQDAARQALDALRRR